MVRTLDGKNWEKTPHPITPQCLTRIYRYVGSHMMHYNKNGSQIKIVKILWNWAKIYKTSILDHIHDFYKAVYFTLPNFCLLFQSSIFPEKCNKRDHDRTGKDRASCSLGKAVARAPISGFVLLFAHLSQLASREDSRVSIGIKAV